MTKVTTVLTFLLTFFTINPAYTASAQLQLKPVDINLSDKASLQRGARTFMNYCLTCHSASYMRYNRMGKDLGLTDEQVKASLMFASEKVGETMTIAMRPDDAKKWFGSIPPDLSVISRARGADWLYSYFQTFYLDNKKVMGTNNSTFKNVGMPHVLWQDQGYLQKDTNGDLTRLSEGDLPENEYDEMARDLVNFLAYIGEPSKIQRLALGKWVLIYLALFFFVAYPLKKVIWEDISK
jgi:ubiquinol-cytochrome c reductase cytochrome c1 subunit